MKNIALSFLVWGAIFLLNQIPPLSEDVDLAVIGTAIGIGLAAASIGGSVASGLLAKAGAGKQARAAERATELGVGEQRRQFDITQRNMAPWLGAGTAAVRRLQFLLGLSGQPTGQPAGTPSAGYYRGYDDPSLRDGGPYGGQSRYQRLSEFGDDFDPTRFRGAGAPGGVPGEDDPEFGSLMREFGLEDFETEPGYEFRLAEGAKALERSAAARGQSFS
ncbi:hypothetical protein LCGC14_2983150, partial [marine sediment metagenome]